MEDAFEVVIKSDSYSIFKSNSRCVGIYYSFDPVDMQIFRELLLKQSGFLTAYIATLDQQGLQKFDLYGWEGITVNTLPAEIVSRMEINSGN